MHTDQEVLAALRARYDQDKLAEVVDRILRVPEAWIALHEPEFLEAVIAANPPDSLAASHLGSLSLGGDLHLAEPTEFATDLSEKAAQAWEEASVGVAPSDLSGATALGIEFSKRFASEEEEAISLVSESPQIWNSPLAIVWANLPNHERFMSMLLTNNLERLSIHVVMANLSAAEAGQLLTRSANGSTVKLLQEIANSGERALAGELTRPPDHGTDALAELLTEAVSKRFNGENAAAQQALQLAWETASEASARIADFTADQARVDGDMVTALEANRKALEILPSASRRARTARTLVDLDRPGEALSIVSGDEPSVEELIAGGLAQLRIGDTNDQLLVALNSTNHELEEEWLELLAVGFEQAELWTSAVDAAELRAKQYPASAAAQFDLARILLEAGDADSAAEHCAICVALDPLSEKYRRLLATIYQKLGEHSKALSIWNELPGIEPGELAGHAIAANEFELAKELINQVDAGARKLALEGMVLKAEGASNEAQAKFRSAIQESPDELEAYIELAQAQANHTDRHNTLSEAMQANPSAVVLRVELAKDLQTDGRLSEALEVATSAWDPDDSDIQVGLIYAELLGELGHIDRSLDILRQLAARQPLSWQVGMALAKAYEARGDLNQAVRAIKSISPNSPAEAYFDQARITLKAGRDAGIAIQSLKHSESKGLRNPELDYWLGIALEREKRFDEALARFESAQSSTDYAIKEASILGIARASLGLEQTSKALTVLEDAQQQYPRSALIAASMSGAYISAKLPEKAQEAAEKAVELDPEETKAWQALADALAKSGDFQGAVSAIERLSALDPDATDGWIALVRLAHQANDSKLVRRSLAEALWRGRRSAKSLFDTAEALENLGNYRLAIASLKAAIRMRPDDTKLYLALANAQEHAQDLKGAHSSWKSCLELSPTEPEILMRSAACAQKLGLNDESVKLLEKAVAIEPGNPWLRRDLAKVHLDQGHVKKGLHAYAGAVKAAPNDSSLAFEAIETALRSGDPRHALALLGKLDSGVAETGRAQAAKGEAFILLDKLDRAHSALSEALAQGHETVRVYSMLSMVSEDRAVSKGRLDEARAQICDSAHDAIWLARAELALLNGTQSLDAVQGWETDPSAAKELARTALRLRDMITLFYLADAVSPHSYSDLTQLAEQVLNDLERRGLKVSELENWLNVEDRPDGLEEWIDRDPFGWIGEAVAVSHLNNGRTDAAEEALGRVRLARSTAEWAGIIEGLIHEARDETSEARASYRAGSTSNPLATYLLGKAYEASGSLDRAATHIGTAVVEAPEQHKWQHRLASIYSALGDSDSALVHFQEAVALDPENPDYLLALAEAYDVCGHLNQAFEGYTAALAHSPESPGAFLAAGQLATRLEAWEQASRWFERAITLSPSDVEGLLGSARASIELGDKRMAVERLELAQQHAPGDPRVLMGEGHVAAGMGDIVLALSAFERAHDAGADLAKVRRAESKLYAREGRFASAAEAMREVLDGDPDDHRLWHELASTYEAGSSLNEAQQALNEAIRISPANPEYLLSLARVSRKSGNLDRAIEQLGRAEAIAPDDPRIPIEGGLVYEDRRDYSRALETYLKAVELDPDSLQAHYRAGILLRTLKAYRRAGEMLKRAAELAPTDQEVMHQLAAVRALELVHG